jgi:peptidoglycan/LPS O-acetylase OafA/YrhL
MASASNRIEYLDSVRGLAALFVLLSHTAGEFAWPTAYAAAESLPFISIIFSGKEAVCMFFVLSGYVLSKPYLAPADAAAPRKLFLPAFYLRRLTRIWLPWFFVFVASILAQKYLFSHPLTNPPVSKWWHQFWQAPVSLRGFVAQCLFLQHNVTRELLVQDWSLGVELKGSLLIPVAILLLQGRRLHFLLGLAAVLWIGLDTGYYYVSFIIGVMLARFGDTFSARLGQSGRLMKTLILFLGLALYQVFEPARATFHEGLFCQCGWIVSSIGCAVVLLSVFSSPWLQQWLSSKPMIFLGRVSYSVYLLQVIIILCLLPPLIRLLNVWGVVNRPALFTLTLLASVTVTVGCAALMYRWIEVPAIDLGHWLSREMQQRFQNKRLVPCH